MRDEGWGVGQLFETNSSLKCQTSLLPNPQGGGGGGVTKTKTSKTKT